MLTRVFPFHSKSAVESVLESCGGDVARAVQQLVGHQQQTSCEEGAKTTTKTTNNSSTSDVKSAFHSASSSSTSPTPLYPSAPSLSSGSAAPAAAPFGPLSYPPTLRMMYPTGVMPFLHPSAYFAAAAANQSWLLTSHYSRALGAGQHHICLPGCSQCPSSNVGGTSASSSSSNAPISDLDLFKTRKDLFQQHNKS